MWIKVREMKKRLARVREPSIRRDELNLSQTRQVDDCGVTAMGST